MSLRERPRRAHTDPRRNRAPAVAAGCRAASSQSFARFALHVIKGEGLFGSNGRATDTQVQVKVYSFPHGSSRKLEYKGKSRVVPRDSYPDWQFVCVMDLTNEPLSSEIHIKVKRPPLLRFGKQRTMGQCIRRLDDLLQCAHDPSGSNRGAKQSERLSDPFNVSCIQNGQAQGSLQLQVQFLQDVVPRTLKMLAVTWNLGNNMPSSSFQDCFLAASEGAYDLVVVATQESSYGQRDTTGSHALYMRNSSATQPSFAQYEGGGSGGGHAALYLDSADSAEGRPKRVSSGLLTTIDSSSGMPVDAVAWPQDSPASSPGHHTAGGPHSRDSLGPDALRSPRPSPPRSPLSRHSQRVEAPVQQERQGSHGAHAGAPYPPGTAPSFKAWGRPASPFDDASAGVGPPGEPGAAPGTAAAADASESGAPSGTRRATADRSGSGSGSSLGSRRRTHESGGGAEPVLPPRSRSPAVAPQQSAARTTSGEPGPSSQPSGQRSDSGSHASPSGPESTGSHVGASARRSGTPGGDVSLPCAPFSGGGARARSRGDSGQAQHAAARVATGGSIGRHAREEHGRGAGVLSPKAIPRGSPGVSPKGSAHSSPSCSPKGSMQGGRPLGSGALKPVSEGSVRASSRDGQLSTSQSGQSPTRFQPGHSVRLTANAVDMEQAGIDAELSRAEFTSGMSTRGTANSRGPLGRAARRGRSGALPSRQLSSRRDGEQDSQVFGDSDLSTVAGDDNAPLSNSSAFGSSFGLIKLGSLLSWPFKSPRVPGKVPSHLVDEQLASESSDTSSIFSTDPEDSAQGDGSGTSEHTVVVREVLTTAQPAHGSPLTRIFSASTAGAPPATGARPPLPPRPGTPVETGPAAAVAVAGPPDPTHLLPMSSTAQRRQSGDVGGAAAPEDRRGGDGVRAHPLMSLGTWSGVPALSQAGRLWMEADADAALPDAGDDGLLPRHLEHSGSAPVVLDSALPHDLAAHHARRASDPRAGSTGRNSAQDVGLPPAGTGLLVGQSHSVPDGVGDDDRQLPGWRDAFHRVKARYLSPRNRDRRRNSEFSRMSFRSLRPGLGGSMPSSPMRTLSGQSPSAQWPATPAWTLDAVPSKLSSQPVKAGEEAAAEHGDMDPLPASMPMEYQPWEQQVHAMVNGSLVEPHQAHYQVCGKASIGQMRIVLLARRDVLAFVSDVAVASTATGVAGVGSNKGAVGISCRVWGNHVCFVNSHLAAHQHKCNDRNRMYKTIVKELKLHNHLGLLSAFHHVFWMGDLNYRLRTEDSAPEESYEAAGGETQLQKVLADIADAYKEGNYDKLLALDQLQQAQAENKAFVGFKEGQIRFPPTFKVCRDASITYNLTRVPAWCDRVLWHSNMPAAMQPACKLYFSSAQTDSSDHKPVGAVFELPTVTSPAQVVHDSEYFILNLSKLSAEGLPVAKMKAKMRKDIKGFGQSILDCHWFFGRYKQTGLTLRIRGEDLTDQGEVFAAGVGERIEWRNDCKLRCAHGYVDHFRGRMLHFKVAFVAGRSRGRRTIGQAALPLTSIIPEETTDIWPRLQQRNHIFRVPLYHGGIRVGSLSGNARWSHRRDENKRLTSFSAPSFTGYRPGL